MQFELTPPVNVPAERAKLRALRDEIAADVARKEAVRREYSPRGFPWLPDLHPLAPKGQPIHGGAPAGALRPGAGLEISPAAALMHEASACGAGCGCGSGGLGG